MLLILTILIKTFRYNPIFEVIIQPLLRFSFSLIHVYCLLIPISLAISIHSLVLITSSRYFITGLTRFQYLVHGYELFC